MWVRSKTAMSTARATDLGSPALPQLALFDLTHLEQAVATLGTLLHQERPLPTGG